MKHIWISEKLHSFLLKEKKKRGGTHLPVILEELAFAGVEKKPARAGACNATNVSPLAISEAPR